MAAIARNIHHMIVVVMTAVNILVFNCPGCMGWNFVCTLCQLPWVSSGVGFWMGVLGEKGVWVFFQKLSPRDFWPEFMSWFAHFVQFGDMPVWTTYVQNAHSGFRNGILCKKTWVFGIFQKAMEVKTRPFSVKGPEFWQNPWTNSESLRTFANFRKIPKRNFKEFPTN